MIYIYIIFAEEPPAVLVTAEMLGAAVVDAAKTAVVPNFNQEEIKMRDIRTLQGAGKSDRPLVLRLPEQPIVLPTVVRDFTFFAAVAELHHISIAGVNIDDVLKGMIQRERLLAGEACAAV